MAIIDRIAAACADAGMSAGTVRGDELYLVLPSGEPVRIRVLRVGRTMAAARATVDLLPVPDDTVRRLAVSACALRIAGGLVAGRCGLDHRGIMLWLAGDVIAPDVEAMVGRVPERILLLAEECADALPALVAAATGEPLATALRRYGRQPLFETDAHVAAARRLSRGAR
jgi:hypothetical protein